MPYWFVIFILFWFPFVCIGFLLVGAHLMYCKQKEVSPVESLAGRTPLAGIGDFFKPEPPVKDDDDFDFYA